jgi:hypothetical protein
VTAKLTPKLCFHHSLHSSFTGCYFTHTPVLATLFTQWPWIMTWQNWKSLILTSLYKEYLFFSNLKFWSITNFLENGTIHKKAIPFVKIPIHYAFLFFIALTHYLKSFCIFVFCLFTVSFW